MRRLLIIVLMLVGGAVMGHAQSQAFTPAQLDPCPTTSLKTSVAVNVGAAATTQLIAGVAGKVIYPCGYFMTAATGTAATYQFEYGTGATCTTPTVLTGAMIGNNGPLGDTASIQRLSVSAAGQSLCLVTAGTSPSAQGYFTFIQQ